MALLKIARMGNPILRRIAEAVPLSEIETPAFQHFIDDLVDTMRDGDGLGLAAPQVHVSKQVVVVESIENERYPDAPSIGLLVLVNPVFKYMSKETRYGWEGCLSVDNLRGKVTRSRGVKLEALDRYGKKLLLDWEGFPAVILQHETDHLRGTLFVDRMKDMTTLTHLEEFSKYWVRREEDEEDGVA